MTSTRMERLVAIGPDRASLDRIARPDAALAIWWRTIPQPLRVALEALDLAMVDTVSIDIDAGESSAAALHGAGYPWPVLDPLCTDIDMLVGRHAALTGEDRLRVRLAVIDGPVRDRFDADRVALTLACTYVGPGIQWCCTTGREAIYEVPAGAVGVFKGRALLDPPPILRRASPITTTGDRRLVLTVDLPSDRDGDEGRPIRPRADRV